MRKRNHYFCCPWIRSGKFIPFLKFVVLITILGSTGQPAQAVPIDDSGSAHALWGEYNGNLYVLRSFYTPPETPEESNYFIDMQGGGSLRGFACTHGLTNNHALFVLSHGGAIPTISGLRYAFFPKANNRGEATSPCFSIRDIAEVVGAANASKIHNLVLAGCNRENMLSPQELRAYFPNATNIVHAAPGTDAQISTFRQALTYHSRDLKFLHEMPDTFTLGVFEGEKTSKGSPRKAVPYVADLYRPGASKPFLTQTAGRELLLPGSDRANCWPGLQ